MGNNNNQSNGLIKACIVVLDFLLLNALLLLSVRHGPLGLWDASRVEVFALVSNLSLLLSQYRFSTIIHLRLVSAGDILRRIVCLTSAHALLSYVLLKAFAFRQPVGWVLVVLGTLFFALLLVSRFAERWLVKLYRESGRNTRTVTLAGSDRELLEVAERLAGDATLGYRLLGYYGELDPSAVRRLEERLGGRLPGGLPRLGSVQDLLASADAPGGAVLGDELYLSVSRKERDTVRRVSRLCDQRVVRFYYVPVSVESLGISLKRELVDDLEVYTTYENPLQNPVNRAVKRAFDVVLSLAFLLPTALLLPVVWLVVRMQSPGPLFFRQKRTGLDGKDFYCLKFRSMHVNVDADRVQATRDDPRKFPFGNFMRRANIDELPQFWNVLRGDMSIVGPRPHMLAHTEQYSRLIDKYMVRHFVKPGVTGWAQVTGYRGETRELWQMEGRVKRDIWYMEHWSIWLDVRIVWLTAKSIFVHDENAY